MFKKSPKNNYFFNKDAAAMPAQAAQAQAQAAQAQVPPQGQLPAGTAAATSIGSTTHANINVGLCYYNNFSLPQVGLSYDTVTGNYIPLKLCLEYNKMLGPYISASVYSHLCDIKEQIEKYQEQWDNIKKFTNPYEYIHTNVAGNKTNISKLRPLSRSFYKMIEIMSGNGILNKYPVASVPDYKMGINTFHLAEGPGGFIEAISYLRGSEYNKVKAAAGASAGASGGVRQQSRTRTTWWMRRGHKDCPDIKT